MNKILLIENRPERMNLFMSGIQSDSPGNYAFLDIKTGVDFDKIKNTIINDSLEIAFRDYDVIICHRSAFEESIRIKLKTFCNEKKTFLILFSGSITDSFLLNEGFPMLSLNSKLLYSNNLFLFLKQYSNGRIEPAILQYGTDWQISLLLNLRDKINHILLYKTKTDKTYRELQNNLKAVIKSSPRSLELVSPEGELTVQTLVKLKETISDKIDNMFAFEL